MSSVQSLIGPQLSPGRRAIRDMPGWRGRLRCISYQIWNRAGHCSLVGPLARSFRVCDLGIASCRRPRFPRTPLGDPMVWFRSCASCGPVGGIGVPCRSTWKRLPSVRSLEAAWQSRGSPPCHIDDARRRWETRMLKRCLALPQSVHGDMIGWFSSGRVGCVAAGDGTPGICREWSFCCLVLVESPFSTGGCPLSPI